LNFVYQNFNVNLENMSIFITGCLFYNNYYMQTAFIGSYSNHYENYLSVFIKNVAVSSIIDDGDQSHDNAIQAYQVRLHIENSMLTSILLNSQTSSIFEARHSHIIFNGYNEFSNNTALTAFSSSAIYVHENTMLNFTLNEFTWIIIPDHLKIVDVQMCSVQYTSKRGNLDNEFQLGKKLNYSILLSKNHKLNFFYTDLMHCAWDSSSVFVSSIPLHVNKKIIISDSSLITEYEKRICLCTNNKRHDCHKGMEGPFYPGQTVSLHIALVDTWINAVHIEIGIYDSSFKCDNEKLRLLELQLNECKTLEYTIKHNGRWCELSLKVIPVSVDNPIAISHWTELYTILLKPCPEGFSLHPDGYCQCDPILSSHVPSLTTCDINHQTIPRPAKTWISARTINNSHFYHVSLHCPFDYCLYLTHHNSTSPLLTHSVGLTGLVCCVDNVNMVSVLCLVHLSVNIA